MCRWDQGQDPSMDEIVDTMVTVTVHNGLFTNFIGCLIGNSPPIYMLSLIHHFLNSLATGPHPLLEEFKIEQILLDKAHEGYQLKVCVKHTETEQWHTHFITSHGIPKPTEPGSGPPSPSGGNLDG